MHERNLHGVSNIKCTVAPEGTEPLLKLPSLVTVYVRHMSVMHQWYQKGKKKRRRKKITTGKAKETREKKKEQKHRQNPARSFDASRLTQPLRCVSNWLQDTPLTSWDFSFFFHFGFQTIALRVRTLFIFLLYFFPAANQLKVFFVDVYINFFLRERRGPIVILSSSLKRDKESTKSR